MIDELIGKTFSSVEKTEDEIIFKLKGYEDHGFRLYHDRDCCEYVKVEDVVGELDWLTETPIVSAEESTSRDRQPDYKGDRQEDSFTWTFYRIATAKGTVVIRFLGESNGYYSESVDFGHF